MWSWRFSLKRMNQASDTSSLLFNHDLANIWNSQVVCCFHLGFLGSIDTWKWYEMINSSQHKEWQWEWHQFWECCVGFFLIGGTQLCQFGTLTSICCWQNTSLFGPVFVLNFLVLDDSLDNRLLPMLMANLGHPACSCVSWWVHNVPIYDHVW